MDFGSLWVSVLSHKTGQPPNKTPQVQKPGIEDVLKTDLGPGLEASESWP